MVQKVPVSDSFRSRRLYDEHVRRALEDKASCSGVFKVWAFGV